VDLINEARGGREGRHNMTSTRGIAIDLVCAERLSNYKLKLCFSDGTDRVLDFEPFLHKSQNPMIRAYLDPQRFAGFRMDHGDLIWDDFGLCFPIADLYNGRL
jgi:hypothetical protein